MCNTASKQLNALVRLKDYLGFKEKKVLVESFILSNFNYCPLIWSISSRKSLNKIESLQKRALRFVLNDYYSSYEELLTKIGKITIEVRNCRILCVEIFKTLNKLTPEFMNAIFKSRIIDRPVREKYKLNLEIINSNTVRYGTKSMKIFGPKVWNSLPYHIKSSENLSSFKRLIKFWNGDYCSCDICFLLKLLVGKLLIE